MSYNKTIESLVEENESLKRQNNMLQNALIKSYVEDEEGNLLSYDVLKEENEQLKEKKKELVHENCKLQNLLQVEQMNEDEADYLISKLKKEIVDLKTEIVDHRVKEYRLTKILNETSDYK